MIRSVFYPSKRGNVVETNFIMKHKTISMILDEFNSSDISCELTSGLWSLNEEEVIKESEYIRTTLAAFDLVYK